MCGRVVKVKQVKAFFVGYSVYCGGVVILILCYLLFGIAAADALCVLHVCTCTACMYMYCMYVYVLHVCVCIQEFTLTACICVYHGVRVYVL